MAQAIEPYDRTAYGKPVSSQVLTAVVASRLTNPLISRELLGSIVGVDPSTVSIALATPYAKRHLAQIDLVGEAKKSVTDIIGDSLALAKKSVRVAHDEIDKDDPCYVKVNTGSQFASMALRASAFAERQVVEHTVHEPIDYEGLEALEASIPAELLTEGEGEQPTGASDQGGRGSSVTSREGDGGGK